ncbi:MAG: hypothetical protein H6R38_46 [Deltaproteobacteria bacterium]|nr:hypothetical protein [Deltaproteobacteria bacterium]
MRFPRPAARRLSPIGPTPRWQPEILSADLARLIERGDWSQNLLLASGDLVYVPRSRFGDIKLFYDQVRPLLELVLWPARVVIDWNSAADITGVK